MSFSGGTPYRGFFQKPGVIGGVAKRQDITAADADILACPLTTNFDDVTGNHVLTTNSAFIDPGVGYNGEAMIWMDNTNSYIVQTDNNTPQSIGGTDPVTFGGFVRFNLWSTTSSLFGSNNGGGDMNYTIWRATNGNWNFRGNGDDTFLKHMGGYDDTGAGRYAHLAFRCDSGAATGAFFWNGTKMFDGAIAARKTAEAGDVFAFNRRGTSGTPGFECWMNNVFISSSALSDAEIKLLSDKSFGHASPWVAGGI